MNIRLIYIKKYLGILLRVHKGGHGCMFSPALEEREEKENANANANANAHSY